MSSRSSTIRDPQAREARGGQRPSDERGRQGAIALGSDAKRQTPSGARLWADTGPATVDVGYVRRPHGVHGEVLVDVSSDVPTRFRSGARLRARAADDLRRALTVRASRPHTRGLIVSFEELHDRDAAATLTGAALEVSRDEVPPAPADRWYPFELVGCRCVDRVSGDLGEVVDVVEDGGGLLLRVGGGRCEILVPFVRALVPVVDSRARRIELELPEGFLEIQ